MKRKILALAIAFMMAFSSYAFAATSKYTNVPGEGKILYKDALVMTDSTIIDKKFNSYSKGVTYDQVKVYDYNTTTPKNLTATDYNYVTIDAKDFLNYTVKLNKGETKQNVATIIYEDGLVFRDTDGNEKTYNVKLDISEIRACEETGNKGDSNVVNIRIGARKKLNNISGTEISTYTKANGGITFTPNIGVGEKPVNNIEIDTKYSIVDKSGNPVTISGVFSLSDIDLHQGVFVKGMQISKERTYVPKQHDTIMYKSLTDGVYIYDDSKDGSDGKGVDYADAEKAHVYQLMEDINSVESTYTWRNHGAYMGIYFSNKLIPYEKYKVKFHENGGVNTTGNKNNETKDFTTSSKDINLEEPTREGYKFEGWYNNEDFSGEKMDSLSFAEESLEKLNIDDNNTIHFYAKWTPVNAEPEEPAQPAQPAKEDNTIANKIIPKTGALATIAKVSVATIGIIAIAVLGIRYFKIKKMMK